MKRIHWGIILLLVVSGLGAASAQTSKTSKTSKIKTLKSSLGKVETKKKTLAKQIRVTKRNASYVIADIHKADSEVERLENRIDYCRDRLSKLGDEKRELEARLKRAQGELTEQTVVVRQRMREQFMESNESALGTLLSSDSLGDLVAKKEVYERIAQQDRKTFDTYNAKCEEVKVDQRKKEEAIAETNNLIQEQKENMASIQEHKKHKRMFLAELMERKGDLVDEYEDLEKESNAIEAQLRKYQGTSTLPAFNGRYGRPVSGRITSGFGMRHHPILGRTKMHTGIDFGASYGSTVSAAAPGVIVSAGYYGGYGNAIIIDHGGGMATLYGHLSRVNVRAGQKVSRGQHIGNVGSSGMSTGPHLHFEIRKNGTPINPIGHV